MQDNIDKIRLLIIDILGQPKSAVYSNGWQSFDCPACAEENGGTPDGHGNLEVNLDFENGHYCHCWKCGYSAKIFQLVRKYGSLIQKAEYKNIINDIKSNALYCLDKDSENLVKEAIDLSLPKGFKPFISDNVVRHNDGLLYLHNRGLTNDIIKKYNLGYVDDNGEFKNKKRIIIPSYDEFGNLNYWLGRDWTNKNKVRYMNAEVEKTSIVFNESLINYYQPIILCEGTFDSMVLPNSIPLLGKTMDENHAVYNMLFEKAKSDIFICLDSDAKKDAYKLYKLLNKGLLKNKVYYIEPEDKDASLIFQENGVKGIVNLINSRKKIDESEYIFD